MRKNINTCIFIVLVLCGHSLAFNLDGFLPNDFKRDQPLTITASSLNSIKTHIPFNYEMINFCQPSNADLLKSGIGDTITGDGLVNTAYKVNS